VPRSWLSRVQAHGLAVVDGRPTLDAEPVEGLGFVDPTIEIFEASWGVQRRGYTAGAVTRLQHKRQAAERTRRKAQDPQALRGTLNHPGFRGGHLC